MTQKQLPLTDAKESQRDRLMRILALAAARGAKLTTAERLKMQFDPERVEAERQRRGVGSNLTNAL